LQLALLGAVPPLLAQEGLAGPYVVEDRAFAPSKPEQKYGLLNKYPGIVYNILIL